MDSTRRALSVCLPAVVVLLLRAGPSAAQGADPRLEKVFAGWQRRYDRLRGVRYRVTGERVTAPPPAPADFCPRPAPDAVEADEWLVLLDFPTNRHRLERKETLWLPRGRRFLPRFTAEVCDGAVVKRAMPREANAAPGLPPPPPQPDLAVYTGDLRAVSFDLVYWPLFAAHGLVSVNGRSVVPGRLTPSVAGEEFSVQGEAVQAGRPCLVLHTRPRPGTPDAFDELWVDPERDGAVVRQRVVAGGEPVIEQEVEFRETPHGWLPAGWTYTARDDGRVVCTERMRVEEAAADPAFAAADFDLAARPGMLVRETRFGEAPGGRPTGRLGATGWYRVDENGGWREVVDENEPNKGWFGWAWGAALAPAAGGPAWLLLGRRRRPDQYFTSTPRSSA
jgi:hypothetical protein